MQQPQRRLGTFDFDQTGRLCPGLPASRMGMAFEWRGHAVTSALVADEDDGSGVMVLSARAGRVPSSARAAEARPDAFKLLRSLPKLLPENWTLSVGPDHSLRLETRLDVPVPTHVKDILVPAVRFCLEASPILDLLEENMIA